MPVDKDGKPKHVSFNHKKLNRKMQAPIIVYGDMECINRKIDTCQLNPDNIKSMKFLVVVIPLYLMMMKSYLLS